MIRRTNGNGSPVTNAQLQAEIRAINWRILAALVLGQIAARMDILETVKEALR